MKLDATGEHALHGVRKVWHGASSMEEHDEFTVETVQDVSDILAVAAEQYKETDGRRFKVDGAVGQHVGLVPQTIFSQLQKQARRDCPTGGYEERLTVLVSQWLDEHPDFKTFHGTWNPE